MEAGLPATVVTDASVLINFLRINRMDLIAEHSHDFVVTDHVADEVTSRYPEQQQRFALAVYTGGALLARCSCHSGGYFNNASFIVQQSTGADAAFR